jgi:hypothetical protein
MSMYLGRNTLALRTSSSVASVQVRVINAERQGTALPQGPAVVILVVFDREPAILAFPSRAADGSTGLLIPDPEAARRVATAYWLQLEDGSREATDAELATLDAQLAAPPDH